MWWGLGPTRRDELSLMVAEAVSHFHFAHKAAKIVRRRNMSPSANFRKSRLIAEFFVGPFLDIEEARRQF